MEYPKEGEYWLDRANGVHGPLRADPMGKGMIRSGSAIWNSDGTRHRFSLERFDLVQRAEVTRVGPLINQDETGGK